MNELLEKTLIAAMDRIIPVDDHPGASQNGVLGYFRRQLDGDLAKLADVYALGLTALDQESEARHSLPFASLDQIRQDALLTEVENGEVATSWPVDPQAFFRMLVEHVAEGYYADPRNGGNPDRASWNMIGFVERLGFQS